MLFRDRRDAGRKLAAALSEYSDGGNAVVLALPRGGVPVGYEVARSLNAPLDVFLVRKLGLPAHPELAIGAIASGGIRVLDESLLRRFGVAASQVERVTEIEKRELDRRERAYRAGMPPLDLSGRTVLLVDDGLATGASMRAAIEAVRMRKPRLVVVAVPVAPASTCEELRSLADRVVCVATPESFYAVGLYYDDFRQTTDEEVRGLLEAAASDRVEVSK